MSRELHKRLLELEIRSDQIAGLKHENKRLTAALAEMCAGQQSQDETICNLQRRVQELESERTMRNEIGSRTP
jgi:hypothetical protein